MSSVTAIPVNLVETKKSNKSTWKNIGIGAAIQVFEVSTLGQPFEVIKTHMAGIKCISIISMTF